MSQIKILSILGSILFIGLMSSCEKEHESVDSNSTTNSSTNTSNGNTGSSTNSGTTNPTNGKSTSVFNPHITYGTMTDQDGNTYKTVTIGSQTWMAENLRTTKYNDGTSIRYVTSKNVWNYSLTPAYCTYNNSTNADTIATYGRLYNGLALITDKLPPIGWRLPTDKDWKILMQYLGGLDGGSLKEIGNYHWKSPNTGAINQVGFTAIPAGSFSFRKRTFSEIGDICFFWSITSPYGDSSFICPVILSDEPDLFWWYMDREENYLSVRCIKK